MALDVDSDNILQPLGVKVVGDSRYESPPETEDYTEKVPGQDGEIDFGCDLKPRFLELHCVAEVDVADRPAALDTYMGYLNPLLGAQGLTFANEPGKVYLVRYSGKIEPIPHPTWFEFVIPFKSFRSYKQGALQKSLTGTGTAVNDGNRATTFTLTITGPVTNPSVTVAGYTISYAGTIDTGKSLIVDTGALTAIYDGVNALPNVTGISPVPPKLQPGSNTVTAAVGGTTILNWYSRWL